MTFYDVEKSFSKLNRQLSLLYSSTVLEKFSRLARLDSKLTPCDDPEMFVWVDGEFLRISTNTSEYSQSLCAFFSKSVRGKRNEENALLFIKREKRVSALDFFQLDYESRYTDSCRSKKIKGSDISDSLFKFTGDYERFCISIYNEFLDATVSKPTAKKIKRRKQVLSKIIKLKASLKNIIEGR